MIQVALIAFADTWGWGCSLVLTDPLVGTTTDTVPLEGAVQRCSLLPSPGSQFEDCSQGSTHCWTEYKESELSWATVVVSSKTSTLQKTVGMDGDLGWSRESWCCVLYQPSPCPSLI